VAEIIAGRPGEVNYDAIPSIIYTWPEVASVGLTEEQVKERDIPYCSGTYPFTGAGRARCMGGLSRSWPTKKPIGFWECTSSDRGPRI
jgi:pyruvate/2-oxoglutarate dehydrogenase complex dihydrolipoamide dehydrogenase (E3) component